MPKITIKITGWRKNQARKDGIIGPYLGALQLITWVLTHGRAARGSPTTVYIKILLRDAGLENVRILKVVFPSSPRRRPKERSNNFVKRTLRRNGTVNSEQHLQKIRCKNLYCCGATVGSEQQHNQNLREIYKVGRILEFIAFYHNALQLTRVHSATFYQNALRHEKL